MIRKLQQIISFTYKYNNIHMYNKLLRCITLIAENNNGHFDTLIRTK